MDKIVCFLDNLVCFHGLTGLFVFLCLCFVFLFLGLEAAPSVIIGDCCSHPARENSGVCVSGSVASGLVLM